MSKRKYKYDVAFSFLAEDESLAFELYKILNGPISCFIYSEEQKRLAGKDGETEFNKVFGVESRAVIVIYRENWGETPWTRIEETAIRNRGHEKGYDFVLFIPAEKCDAPRWLPKNRIWIGLERWGIESAAAVIEARVQDLDGNIKEITLADKVAKADDEIKSKKKREWILQNEEGFQLGLKEFDKLLKTVIAQIDQIKELNPDWFLRVQNNRQAGNDIICYGYYLSFQWYQSVGNSLDGAYLYISFYNGIFNERGESDVFDKPKNLALKRLQFDINEFGQNGWSEKDSRKNFKTTAELVEYWLGQLIEHAARKRKGGK